MELTPVPSDNLTVKRMISYIKDPRFTDLQVHDFFIELMHNHLKQLELIYPAVRALQLYRPSLAESLKEALKTELKLRQNPQ